MHVFFLVLLTWGLVGLLLLLAHPLVGIAVLSLGFTALVVGSAASSLYRWVAGTWQAVPGLVARPVKASVRAAGDAARYTRNLVTLMVLLALVATWLAFIIHALIWGDPAKVANLQSNSADVPTAPAQAALTDEVDQKLLRKCVNEGQKAGPPTLPASQLTQIADNPRTAKRTREELRKACARQLRAQP